MPNGYILSVFRNLYSHRFSSYTNDSRNDKKQPNIIGNQTFTWIIIWTLRLLLLFCILGIFCIIALVESCSDNRPVNQTFSIVDIGFKLTQPINSYLSSCQSIHHWLAFLNTLGIYFLLLYSIISIGYWQGRPGLIVIEMGMFIIRLMCGWLTQSPYSPEYLSSNHDFPDSVINRFRDSTSHENQHVSFFFFFSGHVALVSLFRTYFKRIGQRWLSYGCDIFNILQIIRLLATRGHYTIDLIGGAFIGNYMYSFVADVDKYLASFTYMKYLVRRENTKLN